MSFHPPEHIRPIAVCVLRQDERIFVFEGYDSVKDQTFYRPLGGAIEFGEPAADALEREFREEIGAELTNLRYLGALENIFDYEGHPGHEIILVFEGDFSDRTMYREREVTGFEDVGVSFRAMWKPLADFTRDGDLLYPEGLLDMIS